MRRSPPVDLALYVQALPLLARNPELLAAPFLMAIVGVVVNLAGGPGPGVFGGITGGLTQFILFLLYAFGLSVSIVLADGAWRRGRASFDEAWNDTRRRAGDILLAAIGLNFVLFIASYAGSLLGGALSLALSALAFYFLIYTIPAAAIGGVPGGAAIQISIERVRAAPLPAGILAFVCIAVFILVGTLAMSSIAPLLPDLGASTQIVFDVIDSLLKSLALAYLALVMAKGYADASYGRFY